MLVADDEGGLVAEEDPFTEVTEEAPAVTPSAVSSAAAAAPAEEGDFSAWNIVGLSMLSAFMAICGLLALDVIRNIWSWNQPFSVNSSLMDFLVGLLG